MYTGLRRAIENNPQNYKLCSPCTKKLGGKSKVKSTVSIDKLRTVYDENEIEQLNETQSRYYVSCVQTNPFLHFGIRAHYEQLTFAHCLHSILDPSHRDFLTIWMNLGPLIYLIWEVVSLPLGFSYLYGGTWSNLNPPDKIMLAFALLLTIGWLAVRISYTVLYARSYETENFFNKLGKVSSIILLFSYGIIFTQLLIVPKKSELGWIITYGMAILMAANILFTTNPVQKIQEGDL